jgi:hypothetical protein
MDVTPLNKDFFSTHIIHIDFLLKVVFPNLNPNSLQIKNRKKGKILKKEIVDDHTKGCCVIIPFFCLNLSFGVWCSVFLNVLKKN